LLSSSSATCAWFVPRLVEGCLRDTLLDPAPGVSPDADIVLAIEGDEDAGDADWGSSCVDIDFLRGPERNADGARLVILCSCGWELDALWEDEEACTEGCGDSSTSAVSQY
jgi:hypothetical protein